MPQSRQRAARLPCGARRKVGASWYKHPEPERIREIQPLLAEPLGDIWPKALKNFIFFPNSRPQNAEVVFFFFCISLPFQRETRGTVSPREPSCEKAAAQEAAGLLPQLLHLTFLPRRGRCLVSVSCDQAVTSRYPDRRQLSGLGCARLHLQQTVAAPCRARFSGRKRPQCLPRERRLQTLPGSGAAAGSAGSDCEVSPLAAIPWGLHPPGPARCQLRRALLLSPGSSSTSPPSSVCLLPSAALPAAEKRAWCRFGVQVRWRRCGAKLPVVNLRKM